MAAQPAITWPVSEVSTCSSATATTTSSGGTAAATTSSRARLGLAPRRPGDDLLNGWNGNDRLIAGLGADLLSGREGDDLLYAVEIDGEVDDVNCGPDGDRAVVREEDKTTGCEWVMLLRFS